MNCPRCQRRIEQNSSFCTYCGTRMNTNPAQKAGTETKRLKTALSLLVAVVVLLLSVILTIVFFPAIDGYIGQLLGSRGSYSPSPQTLFGESFQDPWTSPVSAADVLEKTLPTPLGVQDILHKVSASSVYSGDDIGVHSGEKVCDGRLDTNWTEGVWGNGVGEYLLFEFDQHYVLTKLRIFIGSHYHEAVYRQNGRPETITLTFSDGSTEHIRLNDVYEEQVITFDRPYYTDSVKLTIDSVYTGTLYRDTVIAELDFVAFEP